VTTNDFNGLFNHGQTQSLTIVDLISWRQAKQGSRLLLPPIQRSLVWSNEQIINYWDSLLRGYPAGMMIVHRVKMESNDSNSLGRDADGNTQQANKEDFQLFDGQQRMATILLGFGEGQLKDNLKIWVDFGAVPTENSGLKFQLRVSSTGQPFGYKAAAPNQKFELLKRQKKWQEWREKHGDNKLPQQAFSEVLGSDLIDATCAIPLSVVCNLLRDNEPCETLKVLIQNQCVIPEIANKFVNALERALEINVVLQEVGSEIAGNQDEYIRFFGRLGQGGTSLSNDELTYSIIKYHYPTIHDRIRAIMEGPPGRLAGEVDLVLAALRVAKAVATWESTNESEKIGRPSPAFVSKLKDKEKEAVHLKFLEMIGHQNHTAILFTALTRIRETLSYSNACSRGLPAILLAGLPRELVDVLLLFAVKQEETALPVEDDGYSNLPAFVLYWLLFVSDDGKAAWRTFQFTLKDNWLFSKDFIRNLISQLELEGIARIIPRRDALLKLREEVKNGNYRLRPLAERFTAVDSDGEHKPGEALRALSTSRALIKRALMWLQRQYIKGEFSEYDPTSDRDEDLPIDLDHIVPHDFFGFHWNSCYSRLGNDVNGDVNISNNFYHQRFVVGNSLGNFRWLAASKNRSRGKRQFEPLDNNADLVANIDEWNSIIPQEDNKYKRWSLDDIALFQRLIDLRTLDLYEKILIESGIESILPPPKQQSTDIGVHNRPTEEINAANKQPADIKK
jgi:hypothetical protein